MNILTIAEKASTALTAAGKMPALQSKLSGSIGAVQAWAMTKLDSSLGYLSLNTTELKAFKNILNTGNDTLIAAALVQAILAKEKAVEDYATSDLATFRNSVHAALMASVEGHTELGKMTYEGERKDYASDLMTNAELNMKDSIIDKLPPQPGSNDSQNTVFNTARAQMIIDANKARNVSYLTDLLDSAIAIKYPFKTIAAGNGITETITLKQRVGDVGPGTKVFFWMEDLMNNSTYGWQIDGVDVAGTTFGDIHDAWVSAAAATDTSLEAGNQGLINAGEDAVEGLIDAGEAAVEAGKDAIDWGMDKIMKGMQQTMMTMMTQIIAMVMPLLVMGAMVIGAILLGVWLYKKYKKGDFQESTDWIKANAMGGANAAMDTRIVQNAIIKDAVTKNPEAISMALMAEGVPPMATKSAIKLVENLPPSLTEPRSEQGKEIVEQAKKSIPNVDAIAGQMLQGGMVPGMGVPAGTPPPPQAVPAGAPPPAAGTVPAQTQQAQAAPAQTQVSPEQIQSAMKIAEMVA